MPLSSSTFLGLVDTKQFRGVVVQHGHEFGLKIYSGNSMELSVDLKKAEKHKQGQSTVYILRFKQAAQVRCICGKLCCCFSNLWRIKQGRPPFFYLGDAQLKTDDILSSMSKSVGHQCTDSRPLLLL